jgi:hypothetical protein
VTAKTSLRQWLHWLRDQALWATHAARIASGVSIILFRAGVRTVAACSLYSHNGGGKASAHTCENRLEIRLMAKFLFIVRHSTDPGSRPSPEEMQVLGGQWYAWMEKYRASILPGGDGLKPSGRLIKGGIVTDGPYVEAKEVIASFSIIQADNYDAAVAIARECPRDTFIEIRQLAGYA